MASSTYFLYIDHANILFKKGINFSIRIFLVNLILIIHKRHFTLLKYLVMCC